MLKCLFPRLKSLMRLVNRAVIFKALGPPGLSPSPHLIDVVQQIRRILVNTDGARLP